MAHRRIRTARSTKRTSIWIGVSLGEIALVSASVQLLGVLNAAALAFRPFTVIRTRMDFNFSSDQEAADETPHGAFGMIVVNEKAAALGVTGIPGPTSQINDDFFVWQGMSSNYQFVSATGSPGTIGKGYTVDSKAMRKVDTGDNVAIMFEMDASVGALLTVQGRMLVKLH